MKADPQVDSPSGEPGGFKDQRGSVRFPFSGRVFCGNGLQCELAGLDISASGIGLLSPLPLQPGQRITLLFGNGTRAIEGVVTTARPVFINDWRIGVSFARRQPQLVQEIRAA